MQIRGRKTKPATIGLSGTEAVFMDPALDREIANIESRIDTRWNIG